MRVRGSWGGLAMGLVLAGLAGGCCNNPGVFGKVDQSLRLAQAYYDPLLKQDLKEGRVHQAVVAADTTLLLAGQLQQMWCPSTQAVEQLQIQAQQFQNLVQEAGVKPDTSPGGK